MLSFTTQDAVNVLSKAANLNSALKRFLKREVRSGDPAERFVKDLKSTIGGSDTTRLQNYLEQSRGKFDAQILGIGACAHSETLGKIVGIVVDKYGDEFNSTYEILGEGIKVNNQKRFDEILKESFEIIDNEIAQSGFAGSLFLKNVVVASIFDKPVLTHIMARQLV